MIAYFIAISRIFSAIGENAVNVRFVFGLDRAIPRQFLLYPLMRPPSENDAAAMLAQRRHEIFT